MSLFRKVRGSSPDAGTDYIASDNRDLHEMPSRGLMQQASRGLVFERHKLKTAQNLRWFTVSPHQNLSLFSLLTAKSTPTAFQILSSSPFMTIFTLYLTTLPLNFVIK